MGKATISKAVAYHEAGHVVARHWVGSPLTAVEAFPDGTGMSHGTGQAWESLGYGQYAVWDQILMTLAGPWAEARATKKARYLVLLFSGAHDSAHAERYIQQLMQLGYASSSRAAWERAEAEVTNFLKQCWAHIGRVAQELQVRQRLGATDLRALLPDCKSAYTPPNA